MYRRQKNEDDEDNIPPHHRWTPYVGPVVWTGKMPHLYKRVLQNYETCVIFKRFSVLCTTANRRVPPFIF